MASNITLNEGAGGSGLATKQRTHDGDVTQCQSITIAGVTGTEDAYTYADINGSTANGLEVDVTRVSGTVTVDGSAVTQPVSAASLPLPSGAATAANQSTGNTSLATIAGAVSGTEMQVDIVSGNVTNAGTFAVQVNGSALTALQTIDNSIFADDAAFTLGSSSVNVSGAIRDDSLSTLTAVEGDAVPLRVSATGALHVTGGGGGTEYSEDAATPATIVGTATMMERDDALSTLTPIEGDWASMRCDANGALWVNVSNADGTATDDAAFTPGTGTGAVMFAFADETATDSVDEGDVGAVRMSLDRRLLVNANISDNGGSITVDGTVAATQSGTWNVTNVSGTVSLPTGASTAANQATQTTALQLIDNPIVAHDAAVSGSTGVNMAGFNARSADPTAVATADATQGLATLLGKQVVQPYAIPASTWSYAAASGGITNTTGVTARAAAGAGIRNYVTSAQIINGHATVSTDVQIRDGASGTVLWRGFAQAAGGGVSLQFSPPLRGTANTLIEVACGTTGTATYFNLQGYQAAE